MSDTFDARCPIVWPTKRRKMSDRCRPKSARCPIVPGTNGARCPIGGSSERQEGPQPVCIGVLVSGSGQNGARCPIPPISNGARCPIVAIEQNQGAGRACLGGKWDRFLPEPQNQPARNGRDSAPRGFFGARCPIVFAGAKLAGRRRSMDESRPIRPAMTEQAVPELHVQDSSFGPKRRIWAGLVLRIWECGSQKRRGEGPPAVSVCGAGAWSSVRRPVNGCVNSRREACSRYPPSPGRPGSSALGRPPGAYSGSPSSGCPMDAR